MNSLRYALRMLRRNPGFTTVAALTLALGIGVNTAIFSLVNAVMLSELPYPDAGRLTLIWTDNPAVQLGIHELPPTYDDVTDWRKSASSFEQITAFFSGTVNITGDGQPERLHGVNALHTFFPPDYWKPIASSPERWQSRGQRNLITIGCLKPSVTVRAHKRK